jgi:Carbohydrate esterase, sialic acid-specific acetylesterase
MTLTKMVNFLVRSFACLLALLLIAPAYTQTPRKVIIFAGQSNMAGANTNRLLLPPVPTWQPGTPYQSSDAPYAIYQHPTTVNSPSIYNGSSGGGPAYVYDLWSPYDGGKYNTSGVLGDEYGFGPEVSFMAKWRALNPGVVPMVIKCVLSGSSITDWTKPIGPQWQALDRAVALAKAKLAAQGEVPDFDAFIWWQGENGASTEYDYVFPIPSTDFAAKTRTFLSDVRGITSPSLKIVVARIGDWMTHSDVITSYVGTGSNSYKTPENRVGATNKRRDQQVSIGMDAGNGWTDMDGLPRALTTPVEYRYHPTPEGYLAAGERLFNTYLQVKGIVPPPPLPPGVVDIYFGGTLDPTKTGTITINGVLLVVKPGDVITVNVVGK